MPHRTLSVTATEMILYQPSESYGVGSRTASRQCRVPSTQPSPSVKSPAVYPLLINGGQGPLRQGNLTRISIVTGCLMAKLSTRNGSQLPLSPVAGESYSPCPCSGL